MFTTPTSLAVFDVPFDACLQLKRLLWDCQVIDTIEPPMVVISQDSKVLITACIRALHQSRGLAC